MIASKVLSEDEVYSTLRNYGYEPTDQKTDTGTFWRHKNTDKHIQVPESVQGFYPDWLLWDLEEIVGKIR